MPTKAARAVCYTLFRVVLPVALLAACAVRFNGLSLLYLICLLICPLLRSPTVLSIKGSTGIFLLVLLILGCLTLLAQAIFHIVLASIATEDEPYGSIFPNCSAKESLVRQLGFQRLDSTQAIPFLRIIGPDILVCLTSIIIFATCKFLLKNKEESQMPEIIRTRRRRVRKFLEILWEFILIFLIAVSAIIVPCIFSVLYFSTFICIGTYWSLNNSLGKKFSIFKFVLLVYSGLHILVLYLYQFPFLQDEISTDKFVSRLLGLTELVYVNCKQPSILIFYKQVIWPHFVNPGILLLMYWLLAFQCRHWLYKRTLPEDAERQDTWKTQKYRRRRRENLAGSERQVLPESTVEQGLVDGENLNYNSLEPTGSASFQKQTVGIETEDEDHEKSPGQALRRPGTKRSPVLSVLVYIMNQSYVLTLIAMMAWSITFHSWLSFVLLFGACLLWMIPKSRHACLVMSPVIAIYAEILLTFQFIYCIDIEELPSKVGVINLSEIGLKKFSIPFFYLALQVVFTFVFWLTVRQYMKERQAGKKAASQQAYPLTSLDTGSTSITPFTESFLWFSKYGIDKSTDPENTEDYDSYTMQKIGVYIWSILCKYWIFICAGMMLTIAIHDKVIYRVVYLVFFLYFILIFQISYALWRLTMYIFWWAVIIYSMTVLCIIYTYQFEEFPGYWQNTTGLSKEILQDIGLEHYDTVRLFVKLLTPTSFLIVIILQVHYFHKPFLYLSNLDRFRKDQLTTLDSIDENDDGLTTDEGRTTTDTETDSGWFAKNWRRKVRNKFHVTWAKTSVMWKMASQYLWRLAEIHIFKIVALIAVITAVKEVSAIGAVYAILTVLFIVLQKGRLILSHVLLFWVALVMLAKIIYQQKVVNIDVWENNCTVKSGNTTTFIPGPFNHTIDNALWVGLRKIPENGSLNLPGYIAYHVAVLLAIAFESIVRYHQIQHYNNPQVKKLKNGIIFAEIKREDADKGLVECAKYFANYFFYKFGLEVCYISTAIAISVRADAYSVLYCIFLGILFLLGRNGNAKIWPLYMLLLSIMFPIQYMSCLGFPLGLCIYYPWKELISLHENLVMWLFLPNYNFPPSSLKLIADFFQLLFVCLQFRVFIYEKDLRWKEYGGGDNKNILQEVEAHAKNPVNDFTVSFMSYLDVVKYGIFFYMFWMTLGILFIAGTSRIDIFGLGYVISVFCFMWFGQEFLLKPLSKLLKWWNILVAYTFLVIFIKACLQLVGCVYMKSLHLEACWVVRLFGIICLNPMKLTPYIPYGTCDVTTEQSNLFWDIVCLVFLLLQRRIYHSHYFRHVVSELDAQSRLASRGAELINRILIREVMIQREKEKKILLNIKETMTELKEKQSKLKKNFVEPDEHYQAIRSGDYYLFEDDTEIEDSDPKIVTSLTFGQDENKEEKTPGPLQIVNAAIKSGSSSTQQKADKDELLQDPCTSDETPLKSSLKHLEEPDAPLAKEEVSDPARDEKESKDFGSKFSRFIRLFVAILRSLANWLIRVFNKISRNYRMVAKILTEDMKIEKQKIQREKKEERAFAETMDHQRHSPFDESSVDVPVEEISIEITSPPSEINLDDLDDEEKQREFEQGQSLIYRLLSATYYVLISHSELICYFLIILNQMLSASVLSMALPLMVFLWGLLSVPRPSKTFWVSVITYTEAVVVLKYLFQFQFFPWNQNDGTVQQSPFWPPRILGIERRKGYANVDLALLLTLFIHRSILKKYGLWKDAEDITADLEKAEGKERSPPVSPSLFEDKALHTQEDQMDDKPRLQEECSADALVAIEKSSTATSISISSSHPKKKGKKFLQAIMNISLLDCLRPFQSFYQQMTNSDYNAVVDVYAPMFACDFLAFLIIVFGYWAFGPVQSSGAGDVTTYLQENRVPVPFLAMLVVQFLLIIIDRAIFLRKHVFAKFIFQIVLVVMIHIWMFFILPAVTERKFTENIPAQLWYFTKCIYFALSAYQIRSGYPTRILGNFLTKKYSYANLFLFKGFLAVPFLLELRALMDWMWTDTTLALTSWLQVEDIYANIFVLKCWRHAEQVYPTPRATKRESFIKYGVGGLLLFIIIFIIWFPLVLFSFANTVYEADPPLECQMTVALGEYQHLFQTTARNQSIKEMHSYGYKIMQENLAGKKSTLGFFSSYNPEDITVITLHGQSKSIWSISPPNKRDLIKSLRNHDENFIELTITFVRQSVTDSRSSGTISNQNRMPLNNKTMEAFADLIEGKSAKPVNVLGFSPFFRLPRHGHAQIMSKLFQKFSILKLDIQRGNLTASSGQVEWWKVMQRNASYTWASPSSINVQLLTFNDRVAPAGISVITGYGIIGLYVSMVFVVGRFVRIFFTEISFRIMFTELPNVDRILRLCLDIYLVRECREFKLEEDLFAKLLFLFRSPETLIKWTKEKTK